MTLTLKGGWCGAVNHGDEGGGSGNREAGGEFVGEERARRRGSGALCGVVSGNGRGFRQVPNGAVGALLGVSIFGRTVTFRDSLFTFIRRRGLCWRSQPPGHNSSTVDKSVTAFR